MAADDTRVEKENKKFIDFGNHIMLKVGLMMDVPLMEERVENTAGGDVVYQGWAVIGSAEDEAVWLICKLNYDGNGFFSERVWAEGEDTFTKQWDQRATYSYSY